MANLKRTQQTDDGGLPVVAFQSVPEATGLHVTTTMVHTDIAWSDNQEPKLLVKDIGLQ